MRVSASNRTCPVYLAIILFTAAGPRGFCQESPLAPQVPQNRAAKFFSPPSHALREGAERSIDRATPISAKNAPTESLNKITELRKENNRLRMSLQRMELDRLRAVHDALPAEEAFALREAIWESPEIQVTWENPEAAPDAERAWVRDAIEQTWQRESGLKFTNWGKATDSSRGIRIKISDEGPHCKRLGNKLDGRKDGMVLNFSFNNWCPQCAGVQGSSREHAIRAIAVHEFGHAIGFAHEQNRPDAPQWCQEMRQGSNGDWYVTIYDPESIMNYCSSEWNNGGRLSENDVIAVRTIYGQPPSSTPDLAVPLERGEAEE